MACRLDILVVRISDFPEETYCADMLDPYVKLSLHDGQFDQGGKHVGESFKTTTRENAGGRCNFNELFTMNKPENMDVLRIEVFDSNLVLRDELMGSIDFDLDKVVDEFNMAKISRTVTLVKDGKERGKVEFELNLST